MLSTNMTLEDSYMSHELNTTTDCSKYGQTFDEIDESSHDSKCEREIGCDHLNPSPNCDFCPKDSTKFLSLNPRCSNSKDNQTTSFNGKIIGNGVCSNLNKKSSSHSNLSLTKVYLQPFIHQVGGHLCMLKFDKDTLCKPLQEKEQEFYENQVPNILTPFVPTYYGTIKVHIEEDEQGYVNLVTSVNDLTNNSCDGLLAKNQNNSFDLLSSIQVKMKSTGSLEVLDPLMLNLFEKADPFRTNDSSFKCKSYSFNPWSLKRHKEQIVSMRNNNDQIYEFIRLEDLTAKFKYPCVLDLKMGTRQYGDDAPEQKKITQRAKCQASTSASLGVRICGMQVYQPEKGAFFCYDKYIGRKLSVTEFEQSLRTYLATSVSNCITHGGPDVVGAILERLRALKQALLTLDSYRFYSSSLLIMYEGAVPPRSNGEDSTSHGKRHCSWRCATADSLIKVKMIDFAHSTGDPSQNLPFHTGTDKGYLFGLTNLIRIIECTHEEQSKTLLVPKDGTAINQNSSQC